MKGELRMQPGGALRLDEGQGAGGGGDTMDRR